MPGHIINSKSNKNIRIYFTDTVEKRSLCTSFSPTLWAASLHSQLKSVEWSWKGACGTSPVFNFWNLRCGQCCHRSTIFQHQHFFIHVFVLQKHVSISIENPNSFKVKYQLLLKFENLPWQLCTFKATNRKFTLEENLTGKEWYHNFLNC